MQIKIKRIDKSLPLPKFETEGAVGFDFLAREDTVVPIGKIVLIPSNNIIKVSDGYALMIAPRSSTPKKTGLSFPHSVGIVDQDYHGPEDEILIQVYNFTDQEVVVKKGDRIAQGLFIKVERAEWEELEEDFRDTSRGGVGSTG